MPKKTKKTPRKKLVARRKRSATKSVKSSAARKSRKKSSRKKPAPRNVRTRSFAAPPSTVIPDTRPRRGLGSAAGGQSGDLQGIRRVEDLDSESVEELLEEGQTLEAEAVSGVEDAKDPDQGEVRTHEVPQDDVPGEYEDRDKL